MNEQKLHQVIIQAARRLPPNESVPYAFQKRVMHHILQAAELDVLGFWARMLLRAAVPSLLVMAITGGWVLFHNEPTAIVEADLPDIEYAVLVPVDLSAEDNW